MRISETTFAVWLIIAFLLGYAFKSFWKDL
jgi:hypothetical protein